MKALIPLVEKACSENSLNSQLLVDFLKSFFGNSSIERGIVSWQFQIKLSVLVLQKNIFFVFDYTKIDNKVKVTSTNLKTIDKIEESFNGLNYSCNYYSKGNIIFSTNTDAVELREILRNLTNSILTRV
ncbi:MAG: hypothetical protein FIB07_13470 [Candidatus Methanoperedens sp.]|nr:hypothetical protein [Candidatus Methanoperedens sp.]